MSDNQITLKVMVSPHCINPDEWRVTLTDLNSNGAFWIEIIVNPLPDKSYCGIIEESSDVRMKNSIIHFQIGDIIQTRQGENSQIKTIDAWEVGDRTLWSAVIPPED